VDVKLLFDVECQALNFSATFFSANKFFFRG
jgi:hypothetical protein